MKTIYLSFLFLLTVVCLVHTQSCKEKCKEKSNPGACKEQCQTAKSESCKKQCRGKAKPKACLRKCRAKEGRGDFIVGGGDFPYKGKWPWQGSLRRNDTGKHMCGLSVISNKFVMTAAHCLPWYDKNKYFIVLGLYSLSNPDGSVRYDLERYVKHPDYLKGPGAFPNDIAVIEVQGTIDLSHPHIDKIMMAYNKGQTYTGRECYITGWGRISGGSPLPDILQEAHIDVISNNDCRKKWLFYINDGHVCVTDIPTESKGACNGDSGAPLQCRRGKKWVLVGLASWVATGCLTQYPTVYTRVSYFRAWVQSTLKP